MLDLSHRISASLWNGLGACPDCVRKAFQTAAAAWAMALLVYVTGWSTALPLFLILAFGLTTLWLAHIFAFAGKAMFTHKNNEFVAERETSNPSRRDLLPLFARALSVAVVTSTMSNSAFAAGWGACGSGPCVICARPFYDNSGGPGQCYFCHSCAINGCVGNANC